MSRSLIVAANWKMNGDSALIDAMIAKLSQVSFNDNVKVVIAPSFPYLDKLNSAVKAANLSDKISVSAQNISEQTSGAFTGEVSTAMLCDLAISHTIIGHSERRSIYGESDTLIADKVAVALAAGVTPILCIGESEAEREAGQTEQVLAKQLSAVIEKTGIEAFANIVLAYEPVWAIGTGKTASPEMAQETHAFIRKFIAASAQDIALMLPILYGGSVNQKQVKHYLHNQISTVVLLVVLV